MTNPSSVIVKSFNLPQKIQLILLLLLASVVWFTNLYLHPDFLNTPDAAIYADIARNAALGRGFSTNTALPLHFTYYSPQKLTSWPSPYPLFHPLTMAVSFFIFGISDFSAVLPNLFAYLSTIPLLYILGKKLFTKKTALLACLWYVFNPHLLSYSNAGTTETLFTLETTAIFLLLLGKSPLSSLILGFLTSISMLTRFQGMLYLVPLLLYLFLTKKAKYRHSLAFITGLIAILIISKLVFPPLAQDLSPNRYQHFLAAVAQEAIYSPLEIAQLTQPLTTEIVFANLRLVVSKILQTAFLSLRDLLSFTLPSITILYFLSLLQTHTKRVRSIKFLLLGSFLLFISFHILTIFSYRYLHQFLPLIILFATQALLTILSPRTKPKIILNLAVLYTLIFVLLPSLTYNTHATALMRLPSRNKPTIHQLIANFAQQNLPPDAIIATDMPGHISWYADRKTILPPQNIKSLLYLDTDVLPLDALLLTNHPTGSSIGNDWDELVINPQDFADFKFEKEYTIKPEENYYHIPAKAVLYLKKPNLPTSNSQQP